MNAQIISDYFRRWGWLIAVITLAYGALTVADIRMTLSMMFIPLLMFAGPVGISLDLKKGLARTLVMLPIPRAERARSIWFLGVGLPIIWLITVTTIATLIAKAFNVSAFPINPFSSSEASLFLIQTQLYASVFAAFSVMYFALTGLPTTAFEAQDYSPQNVIFGALWGLSIGGSMWLMMYSKRASNTSPSMAMLLLLVGCIFSFWGYSRTDQMLSNQATGRGQAKRKGSETKRSFFETDSTATGFKHMTVTTLMQTAIFTAIYLTLMFAINYFFLSGMRSRGNDSMLQLATQTLSSHGLIFMVMPSFLLASKLQTARNFRSLPLTASNLASHFLRIAILCLLQQCIVIYVLVRMLSTTEHATSVLGEYFILGAVGTLSLPLLLRFGTSPLTFGIAFPVFLLFSTGRLFAPDWLDSWRGPAIGIGAMLICRQLVAYLLANSSAAYRKLSSAGLAMPFYGKGR